MTAKEYLSQAFNLDNRIEAKLEQISVLHALAAKATSTLTDVPPNGTRNVQQMEDIICKIVDLEKEINEDINRLVDLKFDIMSIIKAIGNLIYQTLLEQRYLCFRTWEQIAIDMGYDSRWVHRLHSKALGETEKLLSTKRSHEKPL